jgi:CubicO group peptidase (beta-lactamase class C family)
LDRGAIEELSRTLSGHVERGDVPGIVALIARGPDFEILCFGEATLGGGRPIGRDTLFRIASITKPIVGAAAMALIDRGAMALTDPVARWLPELASPRVLRSLESPIDDTVRANREITVEDVLSFKLGWGSIFAAPGTYPIMDAEAAHELRSFGPPWPPTRHTPDSWIAAFGELPLLHQPGESWRYSGGSQVAGVLVERVAGRPLAEALDELVLAPLKMSDTAFYVPPEKRTRFTTQYSRTASGELAVLDEPDGWWSNPPSFPDASSWLVAPIDDLHRFTAMLSGGGAPVLSERAVSEMLRERTTAKDRADNDVFFHGRRGWGLTISVPSPPGSAGGYGWDGGLGSTWRTDSTNGLTGIMLTNVAMTSPEPPAVFTDFWAGAVRAVAN